MAELTAEEIRNLPLPDLALRILSEWGQGSIRNVVHWMGTQRFRDERDLQELKDKVADAWAWLESHALLAPRTDSDGMAEAPDYRRPSALGLELINDPDAITKVWAADRLAGDLDPALSSARTNFALGDHEVAAFAAMKAVEVKVRNAAGLPNDLIGTKLMRAAFRPEDGPLRDHAAEGGEQQATADLFAGTMGLFKNPASHRTVEFEDPVEAAEVIQLADLLLRIVHRAEDRNAASAQA